MGKRIVIIEDDTDILELLTLIFSEADYNVEGFNTGRSAEDIDTLHPDIVLLDVNIIGYHKNGVEICRDLKSLSTTSKIPVMLLSAEKNLKLLAQACPPDAFMEKPFEIDALLQKVEMLTLVNN